MNYLHNFDECSDKELGNVFAGADKRVSNDMASDVPNGGRERAALPNIPVPRNGGISQRLPWTGGSKATRTSRSIPKTGQCFHSLTLQKTVFLRCEKGVDDAWLTKTKATVPLS